MQSDVWARRVTVTVIIDNDPERTPACYVYVVGEEVVAHGDSLEEAMDAALEGVGAIDARDEQIPLDFAVAS